MLGEANQVEQLSLLVDTEKREVLKQDSKAWQSWTLSHRQLCDVELLLSGAFAPLAGFLNQADYQSVCSSMHLADGTLWPMPITLDIPQSLAELLAKGDRVALRNHEGLMIAALRIESIWQPDLSAEAEAVFGTTDTLHPGVAHLLNDTHPVYVGGKLEGMCLPKHYDFPELRLTPEQVKAHFKAQGWDKVVAFQTRNPMHKAHWALTEQAMQTLDAALLLHPVVGATKPGDVDHYTRVHCYQAILPHYPGHNVLLSLLPLAMRMGGPREALWHGLIRRNFGATHFIVGRDHAGPGNDASGKPFYGPYDAQDLFKKHEDAMGIVMVPFEQMVFSASKQAYVPASSKAPASDLKSLSGTELRGLLKAGEPIPQWFTFPKVADILHHRYPSRDKQGFTLFFTGLSGAGKSTIANILVHRLMAQDKRKVTLFDGDEVRQHLSSDLGFSEKDRKLNVSRIAYVASLVTRHQGIAICAPIAPYQSMRDQARAQMEGYGGFILVHVHASVEACEARDVKGLYAKARSGLIQSFTGISDPYEVPVDAEVVLDTVRFSAENCADQLMAYLEKEGYCTKQAEVSS